MSDKTTHTTETRVFHIDLGKCTEDLEQKLHNIAREFRQKLDSGALKHS